MKIKKVISLIMVLLFTHSPVFADEKRELIVSGTKGEKIFDETLMKLNTHKSELNERDVVVILKKAKKFSIKLIGKDGTQKWQKDGSFEILELTGIIDQMPMRRNEMLKR